MLESFSVQVQKVLYVFCSRVWCSVYSNEETGMKMSLSSFKITFLRRTHLRKQNSEILKWKGRGDRWRVYLMFFDIKEDKRARSVKSAYDNYWTIYGGGLRRVSWRTHELEFTPLFALSSSYQSKQSLLQLSHFIEHDVCTFKNPILVHYYLIIIWLIQARPVVFILSSLLETWNQFKRANGSFPLCTLTFSCPMCHDRVKCQCQWKT